MGAAVFRLGDREDNVVRGGRATAQILDDVAAPPPHSAHPVDREREMSPFLPKRPDVAENGVLHPEQRVKDSRTGYQSSNFHDVLNGNIQPFMDEYLRWRVKTD